MDTACMKPSRRMNVMPWYWILIILSAIIGPFEAMHALNKARQNRRTRSDKTDDLRQE